MKLNNRVVQLCAAAFLTVTSCVSQSAADYPTIDEMIKNAAMRTVEILPSDTGKSIAIYYFTTGDRESELSDYIINGLTTELANAGKDKTNVLSRQALDRIMAEYSHQLSDLVDGEDQVAIGRQLGADLILTGFITAGSEALQLNAQVIEVETARVIGGYVLNFQKPESIRSIVSPAGDFEASAQSGPSETISGKRDYPISQGISTATAIFEDFESGISDMTLRRNEDHWGDRIVSTNGKVLVRKEAGSSFAEYSFGAVFDSADLLQGWEDSYVDYYFSIGTGQSTSEFDGLSFRVKLENATLLNLAVKQYKGDDTLLFGVPLQLVPGEWHDLKLPFSLFYSYDQGLAIDPALPIDLELMVSFMENRQLLFFKEGTEIAGKAAVDDIGFYTLKSADPDHIIESFEDEITRTSVTAEMYGAGIFMDYSISDDGELARHDGVEDQHLSIERSEEGPVGRYLDITADLRINESFPGIYSLYPFVRIHTGKSWADYSTLSFLIRSSHDSDASIEIQDIGNDIYYYGNFAISENWTRIRLPFSSLGIEDAAALSSQLIMIISTELSPDHMTLEDDRFHYTISIDELTLGDD
jgi:hypothetical protein